MDDFDFWLLICITLPFALGVILSLLPDEQDDRFREALKWWDEKE